MTTEIERDPNEIEGDILEACAPVGNQAEWTPKIDTHGPNPEVEGHQPPLPTKPSSDSKGTASPLIMTDTSDLPRITGQCWEALTLANDPPRFFRRGGILCRLERDDRREPVIMELTPDRLRHELARIARWRARKMTPRGPRLSNSKPPIDVVRDVLATPDPPLPVLDRIVGTPVFAPDGTLHTEPGYHAEGRVYFHSDGLEIPKVPEEPSVEDVRKARDTIVDLFVDFPFVSDPDLAHAIALLLLPFVRDMIDGPTPNHLVEAPSPGSGKGLLVGAALYPAYGRNVGTLSEVRDDAEFRKRLTALLLVGAPAIVLDNVTRTLDSGVWASAMTATLWVDRLLGKSEELRLPVRAVWVTTGNNVTMTAEIARRTIRIRLDPKCDRPWKREGFAHPELMEYVQVNRGEIVWAALTLGQAYQAAGRPIPKGRPIGSYESWYRVIGGILEVAGIGGFLENMDDFYEQVDTEGASWRAFVIRWDSEYGDREVGTKDLFPIASEIFFLGDGSERSQQTRFGKMLAKQRDRVIGDFRLEASGVSHSAQRWKVTRMGGG